MKAAATDIASANSAERGWVGILLELSKARLSGLAVFTALVGFWLGSGAEVARLLLLHTVVGTAALAGGAAALNQYLEREYDAKMPRTQGRPLPSGRLRPESALIFGGVASGVGLVYLALFVNLLTSLLGAVTLVVYLAIYTPLKRVTVLNTIVGAIPGALPPLMGWTAARGEIDAQGWALFLILFFWQLPHFLAIAWLYRDEYAEAGFYMLPVIDPSGTRTGRQALSHTLGLLALSLAPFFLRLVGVVYLVGALLLGLLFLYSAFQFARLRTLGEARKLFYVSIIYLPLLLGLMMFDKLR